MPRAQFATVDDYIASFPDPTRELLQAVRDIIREAMPDAQEVISYAIPAYRLNGWPIYFAGFKNHVSLYCPQHDALLAALGEELRGYKMSRSAINFPSNKPLPIDLIRRIAQFRAEEYRGLAARSSARGPE